MAGTRQPVSVLQAKGRKHLTKAEIENRKKTEINARDDNIKPPAFLGAKQKKRFNQIAGELQELKILANIDCEALGRLIVAEDEYTKITKQLKKTPLMVPVKISLQQMAEDGTPVFIQTEEIQVNPNYDKLQIMRGRVYKECRQGAADFGMTVSSRCRLAVPVSKDPPPENKFLKFAKVGNE